MSTPKRLTKIDWIFMACFAAGLAFLCWKLPYGFGEKDESFMAAIALRFLQGDAPLLQEWHPTQFTAFLVLPFVALFRAVTGGTVGLLLFLRCCFAAIWSGCAAALYLLMRPYRPVEAAAAALLFYLYTPLQTGVLYYTTLGPAAMVLCCALCFTGHWLAAGLAFGVACLCYPYTFALFPLGVLAALVLHCFFAPKIKPEAEGKAQIKTPALPGPKAGLRFTLGGALVALPVLAFILAKASPAKLAETLPLILNDPQHPARSLVTLIKEYLGCVRETFPIATYGTVALLALLLADWLALRLKNRGKATEKTTLPAGHARLFLAGAALLTAASGLYAFTQPFTPPWNPFILPVIPVGVVAFLLLGLWQGQGPWRLGVWFMAVGLLWSWCVHVSSNTRATAISMALLPAAVGSVFLAGALLRSLPPAKWLTLLLCAALAVEYGCLCTERATHSYFDASPARDTLQITQGPLKGLRTDPETSPVQTYNAALQDLQALKETYPEGKRIWLASQLPQLYLYLEWPMAGSTTFNTDAGVADFSAVNWARQQSYWQVNPSCRPQIVYVLKTDVENPADAAAQAAAAGYTVTETEIAYEYMQQ